jgi:hypothetical protein
MSCGTQILSSKMGVFRRSNIDLSRYNVFTQQMYNFYATHTLIQLWSLVAFLPPGTHVLIHIVLHVVD